MKWFVIVVAVINKFIVTELGIGQVQSELEVNSRFTEMNEWMKKWGILLFFVGNW